MSRIGNRIIIVPEKVTVELANNVVTVKGPKGTLTQTMLKDITMKQEGNEITLERANEAAKAMHGTMNALIQNMIKGVTEGYAKGLEIIGVGYRFTVKGRVLTVQDGKSHLDNVDIPEDIEVKQISNTEIELAGIDKNAIGKFAAEIRDLRKPEPYKGKGIKFEGEVIRRKEGKTGKK